MSERYVRSRHRAGWLIRAAAHRAPAMLSARLEEEWLAHLDDCRSPWAAFRLVVGCHWASAVISRAQEDGKIATSVGLPSSGVTFGEPKLRYLSLRPGTLFLIVELQAALLCGLVLPL